MDILESVIRDLTSDEVRRFKILSNRFKADEEKKLIVLFDAIRSEEFEGREDGLVEALYKEVSAKTKNSFYRLRNKLLDNLEKSLVFYHFKYKDSIHAYYDIQLSILFRERGNYEVSHYWLRKAEKKAEAMDQFNILELIYGEYVNLALKNIKINIETVLERRKTNFEKLKIHRKNTEVIAVITQRLKRSNFQRGNESVVELLDNLRRRLEETSDIFQSSEGKLLIFRTVGTMLLQKKAFGQLVEYLKETIADFETNRLFTNDNHASRLMMRVWLVIGLYKLYRFGESNEQIQILAEEMKMYSRQNYYTYLFNYYNMRIQLLKCLGREEEATQMVDEALKEKHITHKENNKLFLLISKADGLFNLTKYNEALSIIAEVRNLADYPELDEDIKMYLGIFELVNRCEIEDFGYVDANIKEFRKTFRKILKREDQKGINRFVEIVQRMADAGVNGRKVSWRQAYNSYMEMHTEMELGGNQIILYDLYLKSKAEGVSYYELFTEAMLQGPSQP